MSYVNDMDFVLHADNLHRLVLKCIFVNHFNAFLLLLLYGIWQIHMVYVSLYYELR